MTGKPLLMGSGILIIGLIALGLYYRYRLARAGLKVTSWFRTVWKNAEVGGVVNSRHLVGLAFDVTPNTIKTMKTLAPFGFRKVIDEGSHVHVEVI